jgi:hypothetical protein
MNTRLLIAAIPFTVLLAGCASTTTSTATTVTAPTNVAAARTPTAVQSCAAVFIPWRSNGKGNGLAQLGAILTDLGNVGTAATDLGNDLENGTDDSADEVALQSAAASLQSDDDAAEANLPPACVPGLHHDYGQALTDYSRAAVEAQNATTEIDSGSATVADGDLNAAGASANAGTTEMGKATADIKRYETANGLGA